jgi:diacylglycerol kinase family enzyme
LGKKSDEDAGGVRRLHNLEQATVHCERPMPVQVDGELLGEFDLIELGIVPNAARLLVNARRVSLGLPR